MRRDRQGSVRRITWWLLKVRWRLCEVCASVRECVEGKEGRKEDAWAELQREGRVEAVVWQGRREAE